MTDLPPYRPGSPAWLAGYEHAKRQAVKRAAECRARNIKGDRVPAAFHGYAEACIDMHHAILAMRPEPPTSAMPPGEAEDRL